MEMASYNSPSFVKGKDTRIRLEKCWEEDINWDLYPNHIVKVYSKALYSIYRLSLTVGNC